MRVVESFTIQAPIQSVWAFFRDVERMSKCMPGVESVEVVDDKTYRGRLKVKVGPIGAAFDGIVKLTEVDAPKRMAASAEAEDKSAASAVKVDFSATFSEANGHTEVAFETDVNLRGRLAQFGAAVMTGTARKMTDQFVKNVKAELEG